MAVCSRDAAYGAIATFMVAHSAWEAVSDSHLDPSAPLFSLFHSVLRIPPPPAILHSSHDAPPAHSKPRESDTSAPASDSTDKQSPGTKTVSSSQPSAKTQALPMEAPTGGQGEPRRAEGFQAPSEQEGVGRTCHPHTHPCRPECSKDTDTGRQGGAEGGESMALRGTAEKGGGWLARP
ncbi:hypothetical protein CLOM_g18181 [Closterium sp. NIES-68]|nr:hypothetical protein CLOM_g18181 [Closterium sp. NIES-68]